MYGESTHAALGVILVVLALSSLAAQRRAHQERAAYAAACGTAPDCAAQPPRPAAADDREAAPVRTAANALREGQRMDLNAASESDLVLLPGVGPKLARRILDERARRGGFTSVEELLEVRGMGPKTLARVQRWLRVTAARTDTIARHRP